MLTQQYNLKNGGIELFEPYEGRFTLDFTTKKPTRQSSDIYNIEEKK